MRVTSEAMTIRLRLSRSAHTPAGSASTANGRNCAADTMATPPTPPPVASTAKGRTTPVIRSPRIESTWPVKSRRYCGSSRSTAGSRGRSRRAPDAFSAGLLSADGLSVDMARTGLQSTRPGASGLDGAWTSCSSTSSTGPRRAPSRACSRRWTSRRSPSTARRLSAARPVHPGGDPEPAGPARHLPAARGPAGPVRGRAHPRSARAGATSGSSSRSSSGGADRRPPAGGRRHRGSCIGAQGPGPDHPRRGRGPRLRARRRPGHPGRRPGSGRRERPSRTDAGAPGSVGGGPAGRDYVLPPRSRADGGSRDPRPSRCATRPRADRDDPPGPRAGPRHGPSAAA